MGMDHYRSSAAVDPSMSTAACGAPRSFHQHNEWIRGLREDFNARVSVASDVDHEEDEGRGWTFREEYDELDARTVAWGSEELAAGVELAGSFDRALAFDDFDGPPVYRSVGLIGQLPDNEEEHANCTGATRILRRQSTAEVEAQWLSEMPPLVCRQNAFADQNRRAVTPW
mmetsp:Transcript_3378/g.11337  ORF Transcript_3378/g.11337 Transcript_3378/m.11337 type:complete len:171 (-) Transcript_3378:251-763(-)|eukprot:scaffold3874_cov114-Isochrysis_galbana.AAC.3